MSKEQEITREQLEEIVAEAVRDYMPGRSGAKFLDFFKGKGGRFRQSGGDGDNEKEDPFGRKKKSTDTDTDGKEAPSGEKAKAGDSGEEQSAVGYPGTEEGGEEEKKSALPKETPMSVMKKQKNVVVGQGGQKEAPLVMHIQKMGLSQSTAQAIAKRVGQYLQQRKIPIAEVIKRLDEATDVSRIKSSMFGKMRLVTGKNVKPETKKKEASYVLAIHNVAKSKDPEKFRKFLMKRYGGAADVKGMPEEDLKQLMQYVLTSPEFKKYHKASFDYRQGRAAEKEQGRQSVRALGKDKGVVGKIVSRFVGDNQELINKDPGLKATLDDPVKFNKLAKSIRDMLRRQLKRRGYEAAQIKNVLESVEPTLTLLREQRS